MSHFLPRIQLGEDYIVGLSSQLPVEPCLPYVTYIFDDSSTGWRSPGQNRSLVFKGWILLL